MIPQAPICIKKAFYTVFFCFVVTACTAHGTVTPHDTSHSDAVVDAGTVQESDAQADTGRAPDADTHVIDAPIDVSVPVGACLPRKTTGVPVVRSSVTRVGYPTDLVELFVRKGSRVAVDDCVVAARERDPKLQGKVVLHFELPKEGGIKGTSVTRGIGDGPLHECMISAIDKAPMPVLRDGGQTFIDNYGVVICPDGHTEWPHEGGFY